MFLPLRDDNPTPSRPWLTFALILVNTGVYVWQTLRGQLGEFWLAAWYGLVPSRFAADIPGESITVLTSMFMHGGWLHLLSNMWFLHIFGDNLEDTLGRMRYLTFYLVSGVVAAMAQVLIDVDNQLPMVGASGAIAGVVGGYLVLYPQAPILSFNTVPLLWPFLGVLVTVPAWVIALVFFGQNVLLAYESLGNLATSSIAFAAHLGGFVAGLACIRPLLGQRKVDVRVWRGLGRSRGLRRWR